MPILEWHMVKDLGRAYQEEARDEIGCWNIMEVDDMHNPRARESYTTTLLNLGTSRPCLHLPPTLSHPISVLSQTSRTRAHRSR